MLACFLRIIHGISWVAPTVVTYGHVVAEAENCVELKKGASALTRKPGFQQ